MTQTDEAVEPPVRRARRRWLAAGTAVAVVGAGVAGGWWWTGQPSLAAGGYGMCLVPDGPTVVLEGAYLANETRFGARVLAVEPRHTDGFDLREVRVGPVELNEELVMGGPYDPADPASERTTVLGDEGVVVDPGETLVAWLVADVDPAGAFMDGVTVQYRVGPFPHEDVFGLDAQFLADDADDCAGF
jgi:hypothetical protein